MKKLLSVALALALILSLSVPAFAAGNAPDVLYIDVAGVADSEKTISGVWLWVYANSGTEISNQQMTHVSGTVYSYDISSVSDPGGKASYEIYYTDDTSTTSNTTTFESGKNLFTATGEGKGTWSVYGESTTPETPAGPTVTNGSQNVTGKYVAGAVSRVIYKVDITWGSMAFTYTDASKGTWSTDSHTYENGTAAGWSWETGANEISVTNHSNDGIIVASGYTLDAAYASATMTLSTYALSLASADNGTDGAAGTATTGTITVTPGGSVPAGTTGKIGQIKLILSSKPVEVSDEEALIEALNAGRSVMLAADIEANSGFTVSTTADLDLNGHTLSTQAPVYVVAGGSLTVEDRVGTGKLTSTAPALYNNGGTLIVNSGNIESGNNVISVNGGTTQLNGGTFHSTGASYAAVMVMSSQASLSITGGSYTGGKYSVWDYGVTFTITGGTFESAFYTPNPNVTVIAAGGTYSFDPTAYIDAALSYVQNNGDGTYTVLARDENTTLPIEQSVNVLGKLSSVVTTGGTATLTNSYALAVTETQTLSSGVDLTLDLNGKTLSAQNIDLVFSVPATATMTVLDGGSSGMISGGDGSAIEVNGTLNVQGGQFVGGNVNKDIYTVSVNEGGKAQFSGGSAIAVNTCGQTTLCGGTITALYVNGGKTVVSSGTVSAVINVYGGTLEVSGGNLSAVNAATGGTAIISGGTFTSTLHVSDGGSMTVTGGTFTGSFYVPGTGTLTITGGTFSNDPTNYVPEGCTVITNDDGTYTVTVNS